MPAAFRKIDANPPIFAHDFDHGLALRVLPTQAKAGAVGQDPVDVVSVQLWIGSGAAQERDAEQGMAHFLEHLVFKPWPKAKALDAGEDRPKVQAQDLAGAIEELGGDSNAYTSYDETVYYAHVPAASVGGALQALANSVFDPQLDAKQIALEREVVIEEILQYDDDPASVAQERLMALLYPGRALGRPILGQVEGLRAYKPAQVRAFHRRHYQAKNALVVVSGPVTPKQILAACKRVFRAIPAPARGRRHPGRMNRGPWPELGKERCSVLRSDVVEASLRLGYRGPALDDAQAVALDAASVILGQGESSLLQRVVLREKALVSEVNAAFYLGPQSSTMQISLQCEANRLQEVSACVFDCIEHMALEPCSDWALARATAQLESSLVYRRETVEGLAHATGWSLMVGESDEAEARYFEQLRSLTPASVQAAVRNWLRAECACMAVVLPESQITAKQAKALEKKLVAKPTSKGAAKASKAKAFGRHAQLVQIAPGFTLLYRQDSRVPMLSGQWLAMTGPYGVKAAKRSNFALLSRMLTRGTKRTDALRMAQLIEGWAASLEGVCGWRSIGVYFEGLARHGSGLIDRAAECMSQPLLAKSEWERERALLLDEMNAEQDELAHQCIQAMRAALYGKHPLASDRRGNAKQVQASSPAGLRAAHADLLHAPQVVSVAGDFDPEALVAKVRAWQQQVDAWTKLSPQEVPLVEPKWPKRPVMRALIKDRDQVHIAWGYPGLALGDPRAPALELVLQVLGGQTGRLFTRMREQEPMVYAVSASAYVGAGAGHICIYAATSSAKLDNARTALAQEIAKLVEKGPSAQELERAKRSLVGQINAGLQRRSRLASSLAAAHILGLSPDHPVKTRDAIEKTSLAQVKTVSKVLLAGEPLAQVELGPKGVVHGKGLGL